MPASDQGTSSQRYQFIPRTLIFLYREGQILLLKGSPSKRLWAGKYNGIGGHVEKGEDVLSAAQRELREEAGLQLSELQLTGIITIDVHSPAEPGPETSPGIVLFVFTGEVPAGIEPRPSREGELIWIETSRLAEYPLVEDLPAILPHVAKHRSKRSVFYAAYSYDVQNRLNISFANGGELWLN